MTVTTADRGARTAELFAQPPDEQLLVEYRRTGDDGLFNELFRRYRRELLLYLTGYLGDRDLAEDVLQLTFLQVHKRAETFQEHRAFRPWLYRIATNQAIDVTRASRHRRFASLESSAWDDGAAQVVDRRVAGPHEQIELCECGQRTRQAVGDLPEELRNVIQLIFFEGLKYREAAQRLAIPLGTVKSRMHLALSKLEFRCRDQWLERN